MFAVFCEVSIILKTFVYMADCIVLKEFPNYEIWKDGRIIRMESTSKKGKHLKRKEIAQTKVRNGYLTVGIRDRENRARSFYVHRLVWMAFYGEIPTGMEIDHISTDKTDNSLDNLRMLTHTDNCRNPRSIAKYKQANSVDKGKYDYERLQAARGKRGDDMAKKTYITLFDKYGSVSVWLLVTEGHCGYPRARRICKEMSEQMESKSGLDNNNQRTVNSNKP